MKRKLRSRILSALFWAALIALIIINGLREESLWIGGGQ